MKLLRLRGIVIRHFPFRESSDIVVFFSRALGKVKFMARGRKRPTSQLGAPLELFSLSEVVMYYKEGRDIQSVKEAKLISSFSELTRSYDRYLYASAVCEFLDRVMAEAGISKAVFDLTGSTFELLAREPRQTLSIAFNGYLMKALAVLGHRPTLRSCVRCRTRENLTHFSSERGGAVCSSCARSDPTARPLPPGHLEILRSLLERPFSELRDIELEGVQILRTLLTFARIHTGADDLLKRFESAMSGFS
jgi:DNA repair protein RecO (recombination protein O)